MSSSPPPKPYRDFIEAYPALGAAWEEMRRAESEAGPLPEVSRRLIKLGVAAGAMRQGAVHSCVRKAKAAGASAEEIQQVVALAAGTLGLPSAVAVFTWVRESLGPED